MSTSHEFHYKVPRRSAGWRPGSHIGSSLGTGQEFVSHGRLYDRPDPRRLDLRASLREVRGDWLVRIHRQRVSVRVHVIVDVSASMRFGAPRSKLQVVADFVEALGYSAFRVGDPLGMVAFDHHVRDDLFVPALRNRGAGTFMAAALKGCEGSAGGIEGLEEAALRIGGRDGLVFLVSDFHWPLERLDDVLDRLAPAFVVPMVTWDPAETRPPPQDALLAVHDAESSARRTLWLRPSVRNRWLESVDNKRQELDRLFAARAIRTFHVCGEFDGDALSRYFFEIAA
ncbi:hypothetical protein [Povalibacter sp.]|uniref:DUF58 domain-containing protein n=1 Tax=Povalibacter sp. TaxID=1962978 RepID=UPI002F3FCA9E